VVAGTRAAFERMRETRSTGRIWSGLGDAPPCAGTTRPDHTHTGGVQPLLERRSTSRASPGDAICEAAATPLQWDLNAGRGHGDVRIVGDDYCGQMSEHRNTLGSG